MSEQNTSVANAVEPRQRLLDAAEVEFAEKGYDAASVRDICKRAGMNIAAINYHFGDKAKLYLESLKAAHECADNPHGPPLPHWQADTSPVQKLRDFIAVMVSRMHAPARTTALRLLMRELAAPSPAAEEVIRQYIQPKAFKLREIIQELLPEADAAQVLMIGFSVMGQILFYRQNRAAVELMFSKNAVEELNLERVIEHITQFTLTALGLTEAAHPENAP